MNRNPKAHPFTPTQFGGAQCKWCPFHRNAHEDAELEIEWACVECGCIIDEEVDLYCPRCCHSYFKPIKKEPANG